MNTDTDRIDRLRHQLLTWGRDNIRDYPWRNRESPYQLITAEFMLHRTQAKQVEPVYWELIERCPTLADFVRTDTDQIRKILTPLGLNWRIEGMIEALHTLWQEHGKIPQDVETLMQVNGIGQYIAGATVCFTTNRPVTLVDSNTVRVTGRVFGLDLSGEARRRKEVIEVIGIACDPESSREYYYAMIDLAHTVCTPKDPGCSVCPLLEVPCSHGTGVMMAAQRVEREEIQH